MVSIIKNNQAAIDYVSIFINGQWQGDSNRYIGIGFDDGPFNKPTIKGFCLIEQQNVCCYCCREIDNNRHTELEHIIPRAVNDIATLQQYFNFSNVLSQNIILQNTFSAANTQQATPPFPHHIAYQNIVASCNGKTTNTSEDTTCCNRKRGNEFLPPFNLMVNSIEYLKDGTVFFINDVFNNTYISHLNLNKTLLKNIRRTWFLFASSDVIEDLLLQDSSIDDIKELFSIYIDTNPLKTFADSNIMDSFKTEGNWNILLKYKYFLNYFRANNN